MEPKYCADFSHPTVNVKHFKDLTESELIGTMLEQGVHRVLSISIRDDQNPKKIYPVEGRQMISIWKQVYQMGKKRKLEGIQERAISSASLVLPGNGPPRIGA